MSSGNRERHGARSVYDATHLGRSERARGLSEVYKTVGITRTEATTVDALQPGTGGWTKPWELGRRRSGHVTSAVNRLSGRGQDETIRADIAPNEVLREGQVDNSRVLVYRTRQGELAALGLYTEQGYDPIGPDLGKRVTGSRKGREPIRLRTQQVNFPLWGNWGDNPEYQ